VIRSKISQAENGYYASYNMLSDPGKKEERLAKFFDRIHGLVLIEI
jgi:hypothetical protein